MTLTSCETICERDVQILAANLAEHEKGCVEKGEKMIIAVEQLKGAVRNLGTKINQHSKIIDKITT